MVCYCNRLPTRAHAKDLFHLPWVGPTKAIAPSTFGPSPAAVPQHAFVDHDLGGVLKLFSVKPPCLVAPVESSCRKGRGYNIT